MPDLDCGPRLPADADGLGHGLKEGVAFVAQVGEVEAFEPARGADQLDKLFRRGIGPGRIDEPGGDPPCSLLHGLSDFGLHLFHLGVIRPAGDEPHHPGTNRPLAGQGDDIDR